MTSAERLARLTRPNGRTKRRFGPGIGDGDVCPVERCHGAMLVLRASPGREARQYCPHVSHAGLTRAIWPTQLTKGA